MNFVGNDPGGVWEGIGREEESSSGTESRGEESWGGQGIAGHANSFCQEEQW